MQSGRGAVSSPDMRRRMTHVSPWAMRSGRDLRGRRLDAIAACSSDKVFWKTGFHAMFIQVENSRCIRAASEDGMIARGRLIRKRPRCGSVEARSLLPHRASKDARLSTGYALSSQAGGFSATAEPPARATPSAEYSRPEKSRQHLEKARNGLGNGKPRSEPEKPHATTLATHVREPVPRNTAGRNGAATPSAESPARRIENGAGTP